LPTPNIIDSQPFKFFGCSGHNEWKITNLDYFTFIKTTNTNDLVTCQIENQVTSITMQNGKINAISHQVINQLNQEFRLAQQAHAVVVLAGQVGMFSSDYDLKVMRDSTSAAMA
jgi:hypothetical protein